MTECPSVADLQSVLAGNPSGEVDRHVAGCADCQQRLETLVDDPVGKLVRRVARPATDVYAVPTPMIAGPTDFPAQESPVEGNTPAKSGFGSSHLFGRSSGTIAALPELPGYRFVKKLGRGGMGVVYLAQQVALERYVAIKMMRGQFQADTDWRDRFAREAKTLARVQHPNVVNVHDAGEVAGHPYLVMEWIEDGSLADRLERGSLSPTEAAVLIRDCARGVSAVHAAGVIHRDLKPANILLADRGRTPKVTDFGLAGFVDTDNSRTGVGAGTPAYMAPEQTGLVRGKVGPAADVWALGVVLYELLTGRNPFRAASVVETVHLIATVEPAPPRTIHPDIPPGLEAICLRCLTKPIEQRYASAEELAANLDRFLVSPAMPTTPSHRGSRIGTRRRVFSLASIGMVLVAIGLAVGSRFIPDDSAPVAAVSPEPTPLPEPTKLPEPTVPPSTFSPPRTLEMVIAEAREASNVRKDFAKAALLWEEAAAIPQANKSMCHDEAAYSWMQAFQFDRAAMQIRALTQIERVDPIWLCKAAELTMILKSSSSPRLEPAQREKFDAEAVSYLTRVPIEMLAQPQHYDFIKSVNFADLKKRPDYQALLAQVEARRTELANPAPKPPAKPPVVAPKPEPDTKDPIVMARIWQDAAETSTDPAHIANFRLLAAGAMLEAKNVDGAIQELRAGSEGKPHHSFHSGAANCYGIAMSLTADPEKKEALARAGMEQLELAGAVGSFADPVSWRKLTIKGNHLDPFRDRADFKALVSRLAASSDHP